MFNRPQRRLAGWLALAAVMLHFLAPLVSQALASSWNGAPAGWQQICTMQGMQASAPHVPGTPVQDDMPGLDGHCPFCALHFAHWVPTPQVTAFVSAPNAPLPTPVYEAAAPQARLPWDSPQSRAPPAAAEDCFTIA